ncbi:ParB/RepB/Spo0J family partition protein [Herbiconiux sp. YIM B11900]|uniref:ParB/RepB/Spo0J family partition protein n=1 Tax=Herbiconiux sp. YIM B11900 TaxID=3404131 RepID=UPI003F878FEF
MATKKRTGLGRGIGALIPTDEPRVEGSRPVDVFFDARPGDTDATADSGVQLVAVPGARLAQLNPNSIVPNAKQPRSVFDASDLAELVHSVKEIGVLQPIVVRELPAEDGKPQQYELVMGERRLRATKEAGLDTIPAVIKDTADEDMLRDALLENLHRSQLNPLEEASAYQQLLEDFGITQDQLAERIGRSRPQITNTLRLLKLPAAVQNRVAAGVLSAGHARAVLAVGDVDAMNKLADKIVNEDLSVRAAEALASSAPKATRAKTTAGAKRGHLDEIGERLGDRLNTRVRVSLGRSKGQIVIDFATIQDLNRILGELGEDGFGQASSSRGPRFS